MKDVFYEGHKFQFPDDATPEEYTPIVQDWWEKNRPGIGDVIAQVPKEAFKSYVLKPGIGAARFAKDLFGADTTDLDIASKEIDRETRQETRDFSLPQQMGLYGGASALGSLGPAGLGAVRSVGLLQRGVSGVQAARAGLGLATTAGSIPTGLSTYNESRMEGLGIPRSVLHAAIDAAIEKYTEYVPGSKLLESGGKPFFREMGRFLGRDLTGEEIATVGQDLNAMLSTRPNMTLGDIANDMILTAGATAIAGPLQGGMIRGGQALLPAAEQPPGAPPSVPSGTAPIQPSNEAPSIPAPPEGPTGGAPAGTAQSLLAPAAAAVAPAAQPAPASSPGAALPGAQIEGAISSPESAPISTRDVYLVKPEGASIPDQVVATTSFPEAQQLLQAIGGRGSIVVGKATPEQIAAGVTGDEATTAQLTSTTQTMLPATLFGEAAPVPTTDKPVTIEAPKPVEAPPVTPGSRINMRFGKSKNKTVSFSNDADKVVYQLASTLKKMGLGKMTDAAAATKVSWVRAAAQAMQARFNEPDMNIAMKVSYAWHQGVVERARANPDETDIRVPELSQEEYNLLKQAVLQPQGAPQASMAPESTPGGYVSFGGEVVETAHLRQMQALVNKWVNTFLPGAKVIIVGQSKNVGVGAHVAWRGGVHYLTVPNEALSRFSQISTMAHEFGHMIINQLLRDPQHADAFQRMRQDFEILKQKVGSMTVGEFFKAYHSPHHIRVMSQALESMGLTKDSPAVAYIQARDNQHNRVYVEVLGQQAFEQWMADKGPSYVLNFDEYAAEQVARYVSKQGKKLIPQEMHGLYDSIVRVLKDFYEKVVSKLKIAPSFEAWLNQLSGLDSINLETKIIQSNPTSNVVQFSLMQYGDIGERVDYTTRVINRLPNLPKLKKSTIRSDAHRMDVRQNERDLIENVLAKMPGEVVDAENFKQAVLNELIPLVPKEVNTYASYGKQGVSAGFYQFHSQDKASTIIWEWPYDTPAMINSHFGNESNKYFAHTRVWENAHSIEHPNGAFYVVEIQSDWQVSANERADYLSAITEEPQSYRFSRQDREDFSEALQRVGVVGSSTPQSYSAVQSYLDDVFIGTDPEELPRWATDQAREIFQDSGPGTLLRWLASLGEQNTVRQILGSSEDYVGYGDETESQFLDAGRGLQFYDSLRKKLPKNWWELIVRAQLKQLAEVKAGVFPAPEHARFPTGTTAGRIEGWFERGPSGEHLQGLRPGTEGLFNFYDKTLRNFLVKEFQGQEIIAADGQTWIEVPLKDLKGLSVEYFDIFNAQEDTIDQLSTLNNTPEFAKTANRFKGFLLNALQINQLVRMFGAKVPGLVRFRDTMRDMTAMKTRLMMGPNERLVQWYSLGRDKARQVENLLRDEVNLGVHYTYLRKTTDDRGREVWVHEISPELEKEVKRRNLNAKQVRLYLGIKNDFTTALGVMEGVMKKSVGRYFRNNPILAAIRMIEIENEFQRFREKPYLPDRGFGKYSVMIHAGKDVTLPDGRKISKGELIYWRKFETEWAQRKHLKEMQKLHQGGPDALNVSASIIEDLPFVMRGMPRNFTTILAQELGLDAGQIEKLQQMQYDATKEGAFLKLLEKGKRGVGGASTDIRRVYADYFWRSANLVAKMNYSQDLNSSVAEVHAQAVTLRSQGGISNFLDSLHQRMVEKTSYVLNPVNEWEQLRMIFSLWYLYAVPKSAVMNMTSLATTGWSHLAAEYGDLKAVGALTKAMGDVARTFKDPTGKSLDPDEHLALSRAHEDGSTDQSFAAELAAVSDGSAVERMIPYSEWFADSQAADSVRQAAWKGIYFGMLPFRAVEQFNRRVMLLASYRLAKEAGKKSLSAASTEAYDYARNAVDYTQNDYSAWNKAKFLEGKKSMFLIFYSFVQHMTFFMYGGDKGWWRGLFVLMAMGGLFAIPGMDNFIDMFNWAWTKISGEKTDLRLVARKAAKELTGKPDLVLHGGFHSLPFVGWDVASSVSLGRVIPGTDAVFGNGKFDTRFVQAVSEAGGPAAGVLMNGMKAIVDDRNPSALVQFDRLVPTVMRNIFRATRMGVTGDIQTPSGDVLAPNATTSEIVGQALGFTPTRQSQAQEQRRAQMDAIEWYKVRRENLLTRWYLARRAGDFELERAALNDIDKFNRKATSFQLQISPKDRANSWRDRARADKLEEMGMTNEKRYMQLYRDVGDLFEEGSE